MDNIIRVFARKTSMSPTDDLAFYGLPPLFKLPDLPIHVSATFTWDIEWAKELYSAWKAVYPQTMLGGPAFNTPSEEFVAGRYLRDGVTITSRGCRKRCPWCFVHMREGRIRELEIQPGYILQDNNILACSKGHVRAVFKMLANQREPIVFSGGIDIDFLRPWHRQLFQSIRIGALWFAYDTDRGIDHLKKARDSFPETPRDKMRCYVLIGYAGDSIDSAEQRLRLVYEQGFLPFTQLYQGKQYIDYSREWKQFARLWSRPALYKRHMQDL